MPLVHGYSKTVNDKENKMVVIHLSGPQAEEVFKFKDLKEMEPPRPLGDVPTFLYDDRNPYQAGQGHLISGSLTLKCIRNDKGNHTCPKTKYVFSKVAMLKYSERNTQIPISYTPLGDIVTVPVHPCPLPDVEKQIKMHLVLIGDKNDMAPSPFPVPEDQPFNIFLDNPSDAEAPAMDTSGQSTASVVEAGIQNFGKTSNALLTPTSSQAPPPPQGPFEPLSASTSENLPGPSGTQPPPEDPSMTIPSFLRPRSRSSSPTSGTRSLELRNRIAFFHQIQIDQYYQRRRSPKPKPSTRPQQRLPSPIPPKTPRPTKRKPESQAQSKSKRQALARLDTNISIPCPPLPSQPPTPDTSTSSTSPTLPPPPPPPSLQSLAVSLDTTITVSDSTINISSDSSTSATTTSTDVTNEGTSNETGTKSEDYDNSSTDQELANLSSSTAPADSSSPPPSSSSRVPSSLSAGSADNSEQVDFDTSTALIANASLENQPTTAPIQDPEHVLLHVETQDHLLRPVRNLTHVLHFEHPHEPSQILRAFARNAMNIQFPESGLEIPLSRIESSNNHQWRYDVTPPSPQPQSSTDATYGDSQPPSKENSNSVTQNLQPRVSIERLNISGPNEPVSVQDMILHLSPDPQGNNSIVSPRPGPSSELQHAPAEDNPEEGEKTEEKEKNMEEKREPREYDG